MTGPYATVAKDGALWRWECRVCCGADHRWHHRAAFLDALEHIARHLSFGFGGSR